MKRPAVVAAGAGFLLGTWWSGDVSVVNLLLGVYLMMWALSEAWRDG